MTRNYDTAGICNNTSSPAKTLASPILCRLRASTNGCTTVAIKGTATGIAPKITVTLSTSLLSGDNRDARLEGVTAHEGSHVDDALHFINSFDPKTGNFNAWLNYTHYDTEFKAYAIEHSVDAAHDLRTEIGTTIFEPGDSAEVTYRKIDQALTDPHNEFHRNNEQLNFPTGPFPQTGGAK